MLKALFRPKPAALAGRALFSAAVAGARAPRIYSELGVPDTNEGRFEAYSAFVYLVLERLKGQGAQAAETAQAAFDAYARSLDDSLREMGVGDLSVGKKMRKLGEAFYGRVRSWEGALAALPDRTELNALIGRTLLAGSDPSLTPALADYLLAERERLAAHPLDEMLAGRAIWSAR